VNTLASANAAYGLLIFAAFVALVWVVFRLVDPNRKPKR
jgi:hypothetical protein